MGHYFLTGWEAVRFKACISLERWLSWYRTQTQMYQNQGTLFHEKMYQEFPNIPAHQMQRKFISEFILSQKYFAKISQPKDLIFSPTVGLLTWDSFSILHWVKKYCLFRFRPWQAQSFMSALYVSHETSWMFPFLLKWSVMGAQQESFPELLTQTLSSGNSYLTILEIRT